MKRALVFILTPFLLGSCLKHNSESTIKKLDFQLTDTPNVKITSLPEGTHCLVYTEYPFDEQGELSADPIIMAYAPVDKRVQIAKYVSKLYVYANGKLYTYVDGVLTPEDSGRSASMAVGKTGRGEEQPGDVSYVPFSEAFITAVYSYYPEAQINLQPSEYAICTDLKAPQGDKIVDGVNEGTWGNTRVWITYVGHGGTNFFGTLWYYTYTTDGTNYYPAGLPELTEVFDVNNNTTGRRVYLGEFEPGTRVGFVYKGISGYRYSTPYYNNIENPGNFVANGVIRRWDYTENGVTSQYATIGMENRLPGEKSWDGDYNDMICLLEADPLVLENDLPEPTPDPEKINWQGYWLFEDNYPYEGDYDFNDLVVRYSVTEYSVETVIDLEIMATGASYKNSFGVNGNIYFNELQGYNNVHQHWPKAATRLEQIRVPLASNYIPMLNNERMTFNLNTYNENNEKFPCVLNIPIVNKSTFKWCLESVRIDDAYPRYKAWVESGCKSDTNWFTDTPIEGTVWDK